MEDETSYGGVIGISLLKGICIVFIYGYDSNGLDGNKYGISKCALMFFFNYAVLSCLCSLLSGAVQ